MGWELNHQPCEHGRRKNDAPLPIKTFATFFRMLTLIKFFRVSLKKKSLLCNGADSAKCYFKFKAFNVKTETDRSQTSPVFADHCFNPFSRLERYAARYRTPFGPTTGRGPVFADHCFNAFTSYNKNYCIFQFYLSQYSKL